MSLFELLIPNKAIQRAIAEGKQEGDIQALAQAAGFKTMREDGIAKILAGLTTVEEVIKVTI
jgi:type II secretory ATPase GspE/PulE/Tfp pilus assembly ATPase PilB-like protein